MVAEQLRVKQDFDVFVEHMPFGTDISGVNLTDVPPEALGLLLQKGAQYLLVKGRQFNPGDLQNLTVVTHPDRTRTYVAQSLSVYPQKSAEQNKVELTHLVDVTSDNVLLGWGHIRKPLVHKTLPTDQPFVGHTFTIEEGTVNFRERGFGTRRLLTMNALSSMYYGMPLYSSGVISPQEKSLWKHLVDRRIASSFRDVDNAGWSSTRYVFRS